MVVVDLKEIFQELIQIMNTDPNGSGVHWFVFSTLETGPGIVNIYDSSPNPGNPSSAVENAIAKLVHTEAAMLTLKFMGCDQQERLWFICYSKCH